MTLRDIYRKIFGGNPKNDTPSPHRRLGDALQQDDDVRFVDPEGNVPAYSLNSDDPAPKGFVRAGYGDAVFAELDDEDTDMEFVEEYEVDFMSEDFPIAVKRVDERAMMPERATEGASGFDLYALESYRLWPNAVKKVRTGIAVAIPRGYEGQIRPRSGLALNKNITVANAPGTVDSDYRGEICVLLVNLGNMPIWINKLDRIAQLVIAPVAHDVVLEEAETLDDTDRGSGGFGSTGQ